MFTLACGHCYSPDLEIATKLPFVFYWGLLFYGWSLIGGVVFLLKAASGRDPQPLRPLAYLGVAVALAVPTGGSFLMPLFVVGPVLLARAGQILRSSAALPRLYQVGLRAPLLAAVALVPVSFVRVCAQFGDLYCLGFDGYRPSVVGALLVPAAAAFFFCLGLLRRPAPTTTRPARSPRSRRARGRRWKVVLQPQQGCPLCWEVLDPAEANDLTLCGDCQTVAHFGCVAEMGGCATLGCSRGRRGRRRHRSGRATSATDPALRIQARARAGREVLAPALA